MQSEGRCRQRSSETTGTAKPGPSPLSLSHSITGLVLSPCCTLSHRQDNLLREAGLGPWCLLREAEYSCRSSAVTWQLWVLRGFRGHSSLALSGHCPGKFYLLAQLPAAVEGGRRTSEGSGTQLPLQHQLTALQEFKNPSPPPHQSVSNLASLSPELCAPPQHL